MASTIQTTGTLSNGRIVTLDNPITTESGRVLITLEVVPTTTAPRTFQEALETIWENQRKRGHVPRTAEEIEEQIREERESWGD